VRRKANDRADGQHDEACKKDKSVAHGPQVVESPARIKQSDRGGMRPPIWPKRGLSERHLFKNS